MKLPKTYSLEINYSKEYGNDFIILKRNSEIIKKFITYHNNFNMVIEQACIYAQKVYEAEKLIEDLNG